MSLSIQKLKKIRLHGVLGDKFGRVHKLAVDSPQEAVKALSTIIPGFHRFMIDSERMGLTFAVFEGKRNLSKDELMLAANGDDIRISPIVIGSKKAGVFQTILGAVLIAVSVWNPGFLALSASAQAGMFAAGSSMMLGGVVQMLSPMQGGLASRQSEENKPSYAFGGPVNTIAQGNPVGILYGKRRIGGAIISAGIYAEDSM